ncbi:MAG: ATP-binding protein [Anaerolineae bacterium]
MPKERIMVVDDEPDVLDLCIRVLTAEGYEVQGVDSGQEAIALVKRARFNLLLTDIKMPDIGGLEIAQAVKKSNSDIICVTMTGYGTMDTAIQALKLGVDEFIVKPFTPDELCLAVAKAIDKERLHRENVRLQALIPLFELNKILMAVVDFNEVLDQVVRISRQETGADRASLLLLDVEGQELSVQARATSPSEPRSPARESFEEAIARQVVELGGQLILPGGAEENKLAKMMMEATGARSLIASPLLAQDRLIGALIVTKDVEGARFAPGDAELLLVLSGQAAVAIENARLFEEIQRAYNELKELDRLKGEFINIAAHELRTPLALLMGYVSLVEEEAVGETKERMRIIGRNALRLKSLIDNMLDLSNLDMGQSQLRLERFSPVEAIASVVRDLRPLARDKGHKIKVDVASDLAEINTDRRKFDLVLFNLLSNAIKFTPPGGEIGIEAKFERDELVVAVWDKGIGIPPSEQKRIFDRFYQVENSLTREHGGIGLGLSIAKGMIELCGGRIWVESELGQGSTFTFTIPR